MLVSQVGDDSSKAFIQPEVVPPLHRHHIAEPLMTYFMHDGDR